MPSCDACGAHVSGDFYRVWAIDGELQGCPECVPRSHRFGPEPDDAYDGDFGKARHNAGKAYGGIKEDRDETVPTR